VALAGVYPDGSLVDSVPQEFHGSLGKLTFLWFEEQGLLCHDFQEFLNKRTVGKPTLGQNIGKRLVI
jgi:hypothetical protein